MCSIEFIESPILNISSAIVYARPGQDSDLRDQLIELPGVERHAASALPYTHLSLTTNLLV